MLFGALEAGGTKMVCAIGNENGEILEQKSFPTLTPDETIPDLIGYFRGKDIKALGIACFGPIDPVKDSPTFGYITSTPKPGWANYNIVKVFKDEFNIPVGFDVDVNGSLLGEVTWGSSKGLKDVVYYTIGTGIGAGVMVNGALLHGVMHAEAGHLMMLPENGDTYKGHCPFHGRCVEGMASGPAIEERWGKPAKELTDRPEVWDLEAKYIAQQMMNTILMYSPKRIILGGGVMHQEKLLMPLIRKYTLEKLNGYIVTEELQDIDNYIVTASLNDDQGIMGAVKLGMDALEEK